MEHNQARIQPNYFYPRSPCGERPVGVEINNTDYWYFYPRSPCGERQCGRSNMDLRENFYPRSPCGERRGFGAGSWRLVIFLSTLSLRRATVNGGVLSSCFAISIHALLAESDLTFEIRITTIDNFYPRSPCGERRTLTCSAGCVCLFLSTLSLRRATAYRVQLGNMVSISIHALLAESDCLLVY